jgi:hypothetical protein
MSFKQAGKVWDLDLPNAQQSVLLALADHADHEGASVRPSLGLVAWKVGYSKRQVRRIVAALREAGLIVEVAAARSRRAVEYQLCLEAGRRKEPYQPDREDREDIMSSLSGMSGGTSGAARADIAVSAEPPVVEKPDTTPPAPPSVKGGAPHDQGSGRSDNDELAAQRLSEILDQVRPAIGELAGAYLRPLTAVLDGDTLTLAGPSAGNVAQATFRPLLEEAAAERGLVLQFNRPPPSQVAAQDLARTGRRRQRRRAA